MWKIVNSLVHRYDVAKIFVVHTIIDVDKTWTRKKCIQYKNTMKSIGTGQKIVHSDSCVEHYPSVALPSAQNYSHFIDRVKKRHKPSLTESDHCPRLSIQETCDQFQTSTQGNPRSIGDQFWTRNDRHYPIIKWYFAWVVLFGASVLGSLPKIGAASLFPWGKCVVFVSR